MQRYVPRLAWMIALVVAAPLAATAQDKQKPALDTDFLIQCFTCGHAEMKYSELADKRSGNEKVKAFARKLVDEHKAMMTNLDQFVADRKLAIVAGTEKASKDEIARLSKLEGAAFDHAYLQRMVEDHERAIQMFEAQSKQGTDAKLNAFAKDNLPKLREHLKEAKALQGEAK